MRNKGIRLTIVGAAGCQIVSELNGAFRLHHRQEAVEAYHRNRDAVIAFECVDSYDREHHEISLRYMNGKIAAVMDNVEICKMLANLAPRRP